MESEESVTCPVAEFERAVPFRQPRHPSPPARSVVVVLLVLLLPCDGEGRYLSGAPPTCVHVLEWRDSEQTLVRGLGGFGPFRRRDGPRRQGQQGTREARVEVDERRGRRATAAAVVGVAG